MWYKTGTINLTANNATVTGTGTAWADAKFGVMPGMILLAPDNKLYEVKQVNSNTSLTLNSNYAGSTASGQSYAIITTYEGDISQFSARFAAMLTFFQGSRNDTVNWFTGSGDMTFTKDDGTKLSVPTLGKIQSDYLSKSSTANQHVTGSVSFSPPIGMSLSTSQGFLPRTQGAWVGWNRATGATGGATNATDFVNHKGSGSGGFNFWNSDGTIADRVITIGGSGNILQRATAVGNTALVHNFYASDDSVKASFSSNTVDGSFSIKWNGTSYSMNLKSDGTITVPNTLYIGTIPVLKAGEYGIGGGAAPFSGDIDDNTIPSGNYYVSSAATGTKPQAAYGHMSVSRESGGGVSARQMWTANSGDTLWVRCYINNAWSTWKSTWNSGNLPNPLSIGDYGLGRAYGSALLNATTDEQFYSWCRSSANGSQFFRNNALGAGVAPQYCAGVLIKAADTHMAIIGHYSSSVSRILVTTGNTNTCRTHALWTDNNTTVDANGFLKKASPIARLTSNPEKMTDEYLEGFTLSGLAAVNGEAAGVTAERVSVGVYQVTGSLGFALEGWNIEVPQDVNGNRLCFVATESAEDGTITVKVSKRRFDIDTAAIVAGEPMDIPEGRWIDLRLEMPPVEEVQSEPEPESNDGEMTDE